ncbi:zinc ribbon domain-containing protein [Micromonospora sp. NBC_01796]|uniref:zinc ribbon domain-containing protein n=1 Tax=Micromonospora sp. NBC_01796 TaxID=2975987 RepID=UPI002DD859E2|nr:zinc ribbon domain-containing protein [Micromonospora sp. NBC_01796]WSA84415.1 zinc ribbon domain-containing protein [Micromonospora sp. NBC_01796]
MATYGYRCPRDGEFEVRFPIGTATASVHCAVCRGESTRIFTAPLVNAIARPLVAAVDRTGRSAEAPEVVSRIPGHRPAAVRGPGGRGSTNPAHLRLPRP